MERTRVGVIVDCVGSYGRNVIRGIMAFAHAHPGWSIQIAQRWAGPELPDMSRWEIDGLIIQVMDPAVEEAVLAMGIPVVSVSNHFRSRIPTVVPDDAAVGRMAVRYFHERGFSSFACYGRADLAYCHLRMVAFEQEVKRRGGVCHLADADHEDLARWLEALPKPAALLGCNDDWAHRVLQECQRLKIRVPDDIAVLGVDDDELFAAIVTPSLSSIQLPTRQIGYEAARTVQSLLAGKRASEKPLTLLPVAVMSRQSSDVLAVQDPDVSAAVNYIREHAAEAMTIGDILSAVAVSRRSLERKFRTLLGRSISVEIRRMRVERIKQLLTTTDMGIKRIGMISGFPNATRLGVVFRKVTGMSPREFRQHVRARMTDVDTGAGRRKKSIRTK